MSAAPVLSAHALTKVFRGRSGPLGSGAAVRALDGLDLELRHGETLALVGESGCGKSTLARCLMRLLEPSSGDVRFEGTSVLELRGADLKAFRRRVQIVFQDPTGSLNPRRSAAAAVEEVLAVHGLAQTSGSRRRRAAELLERVGLTAAESVRLPHELSGGQRQRVGIARALAVQPRVLVLDEPVSALDVSIRAQIVNLLRDLQAARDLSYLFIAHDLALVEHLSDRVAVMQGGRIVEEGATERLFRTPRHPHTRELLDAVPRLHLGGAGRPPGQVKLGSGGPESTGSSRG